MPQIEIDFDVFKALTARRSSEDVTENDVLRQILHLGQKSSVTKTDSPSVDDWIVKGVRFPAGTEFRAKHKGRVYLARVSAGAMELNARKFDSPSAAAVSITGNAVNGWKFWQCRFPGQSKWQELASLRERVEA